MLSILKTSVLLTALSLFNFGCAAQQNSSAPSTGYTGFQTYAQASQDWVKRNRNFQTDNTSSELKWNSPYELRPSTPTNKAFLLIHGLGDSPWSFTDISKELVRNGYAVRTVLLSGHGTKPEDLVGVSLEDWQGIVREQVQILHNDFSEVYIGGFSTGANLALEYAVNDPEIQGLLLFSPAFRSNEYLDWVTPWLAHFRTWLRKPDETSVQSPFRYHNVPTNGFAQFYRSSAAVRKAIKNRKYNRPSVLILTEHDSVLDVGYIKKVFNHNFSNAASRLIWYGRSEPSKGTSSRVLTRTDYLPQERISQFSHMGILFSPQNRLYGKNGSIRICRNGQTEEETAVCNSGGEVWFSDWGYREDGKVHARLTYNPYFDWQMSIIKDVLDEAERQPEYGSLRNVRSANP